jgi:hypothetical protein
MEKDCLQFLFIYTMAAKKFWPSISVPSKKNCKPYFIVIMITDLIMIGIFGWYYGGQKILAVIILTFP